MTREEYQLLFEKYLSGKATPEETAALLAYQDNFDLIEPDPDTGSTAFSETEDRIMYKLSSSIYTLKKVKNYRRISGIAASLALLISFAAFFLLNQPADPKTLSANRTIIKNDIKPATNNTLLTLSNGKVIILNDIKTGTVLQHGNIKVTKGANGLLQVNASAKSGLKYNTPEFNTISTPVGGHYEVVLPDGSKVWLNAASVLKFPSVFTNGERKVELTGEAYFEVAKNKQLPFKVQFNNNLVEVLGTHFNIMAYKDEAFSKTTLLEGSVSISADKVRKVLVPGQQAISTSGQHTISLSPADEEGAMAWKDNIFLFRNDNIRTIMRQLARWYDIDVSYQGNTDQKDYGIRMSKSKNLSEVLKNLELTGTIHFKVEGRRVIVME